METEDESEERPPVTVKEEPMDESMEVNIC